MRNYLGLTLTFVGVVLLFISYFTGLSHFNFVLLAALFLVVAGIVWHVWCLKRQEKY
ncbi:MAG: hypothetical protein IJ612_00400 [Prevotella sp.]|nr:hypothetical protein [Prevotella sp.]